MMSESDYRVRYDTTHERVLVERRSEETRKWEVLPHTFGSRVEAQLQIRDWVQRQMILMRPR